MANVDLSSPAGAKAAASRLAAAISYESKIKMPPAGRLKDGEIAALTRWAESGAAWPESATGGSHWAFQPRKRVSPPPVRNTAWVRNEIDRFLLARQEAQSLSPAAPADALTLLRRVTFNLTGLPPTASEIAAFQADTSPGAFDRVVERLLASPRYGEHWGRHWMDVARYADSTGADEDHRYPHAWRYRDYVIDAFNRDLPYDQFVREQVAGDLLPSPSGGVNTRGIVATGFLALGPKLIAEQDKVKMFYDIVDEQIEVTGKAFLGLTLACARCHDHKFDPIPTRDYYSLASIFASTKQLSKLEGTVSQLYFSPLVDAATAGEWESHQKKLEAKQKEIDGVIGQEQARYRKAHLPKMAEYMLAARRVYQDGKPLAEAAAGLDAWVVEQWANYLKPTGERRHHLEDWELAPSTGLEAAAKRYHQRYLTTEKFRADARERWKRESEAAKSRGEKAPPEPRFLAGDDRFFSEVNAASGPFKMPEKDRESLYAAESRTKLAALRVELDQLKKSGPAEPPLACAVAEGDPVDQHVFVRGNPEAKGDAVPKRLPGAIAGDDQPPIRGGSGRRELAAWLGDPANPLTARVMVNRIWQWHFGEGLVRTPNNFGKLGAEPTHPELLDWLAQRFIDSGWSVKAMHRLILASSAYRMSSAASKGAMEGDAENRLLSRFPARRLAVEEIRDSLLLIDGTLDLEMGGKMMEGSGTDKEFAEARKTLDPDRTPRRLVYLPLRRSNLPSLLNLFDFGDATTSNEGRTQTNVAPQALYMMNSGFVEERARTLAAALLADARLDDAGRIRNAHLRILNRPADSAFVDTALTYLAGFPGGDRRKAWTSLTRTMIASNDFLYVH
ncbi:MAG: DUF1549 and DUF1553 domain-containing protein [Bryobacteraceae bacterium]|nr:DUF1549 and DUF1553 domain-containing protein [Bryobacteraceae bacterium]